MAGCTTFTCDDPTVYQAAIRGGQVDFSVTAKGSFSAKLVHVDLDTVWLQYGYENLPRVSHSVVSQKQAGVIFNADPSEAGAYYCGIEVTSNAMFACGAGSPLHIRTSKPHSWAGMALTPENLSAASRALVGRELTKMSVIRVVRPHPARMTRLARLHAAARRLAEAAPDTLAHPEVSNALDHELTHALVTCLADEEPTKVGSGWRHHTAVIERFEQALAANSGEPLYLAEICAVVGASERVLRLSCEEHLGMGPIRYLWLRRMHLARRALLRSDPANTTVTQIATDHGFWELGRFSVAYTSLFGESPSATLRKPEGHHKAIQIRPSSLANSDFA
jgi:AraC-like DNA-binding protein